MMFPESEQMCVLLDFILCNSNADNCVKRDIAYCIQNKKRKEKKSLIEECLVLWSKHSFYCGVQNMQCNAVQYNYDWEINK